MRRNNLNGFLFILTWTIVVLFQFSATSFAQTTAFNFQGRLSDGANPANGNFELQFALFDSAAGGIQISSTVTRPSVAVTNGIFSTQLDFSATAFSGAARFIEIGVRPTGTTNPFTILTPRQQVLSSPYSIKAKNSDQLGGIDANQYVTTATVGSSFIRNGTTAQTGNFNLTGNGFVSGNFGIGTTTPLSPLTVRTASDSYGFNHTDGTVILGSYVGGISAPNGGWIGTRSSHPLHFFTSNAGARMTIDKIGNVGIGRTDPAARLHVVTSAAGGTAVQAESDTGFGVLGRSTSDSGVYGSTQVASLTAAGVYGYGAGNGSIGVTGSANNGTATGVYGVSTSPTGFGIYARNNFGGRAIFAEGNVTQTLSSNGLVKAMLYVQQDGVILRCYNGITNISTGNCGFSVNRLSDGDYFINFGFQVDNRFFTITARNPADPQTNVGAAFTFVPGQPNQINVQTFISNVTTTGDDAYFMMVVY